MRVLHLLAPAPFGGLESVVQSLAGGQRQAGAEVHVAVIVEPDALPHPFVQALEEDGLRVRVLNVPHRSYGHERRLVESLLLELEPDVLHTHGYRPDVLDAPMARAAGVPTVTTVHGFTRNGLKNRMYEWLQRRAFRRFDAVLAVSAPLHQELRASGIAPGRLHLMPNGWEASTEPTTREEARDRLGLPADARVVGCVGRLSTEKAPDVLVRALAAMESDEPKPIVAFIGDGPLEGRCQDAARELGVGHRIRWLGRRERAGQLMPAFDILALPSRTEGTPIVVFEAAAAGVPVVGTRVGGVPDLLGPGPNLVDPDDAEGLADALGLMLQDADARTGALDRIRARIESDHALEPWVQRHLDLYRDLACG